MNKNLSYMLGLLSGAGILTVRLPLGVECMYIHGEVKSPSDFLHCIIVGCEFVGLVDTLSVPVGPVQHVLKNSQRKRVWQT